MLKKKSLIRHIPNTITCLNLFCGCLSIVSSFEGRLITAAYFILVAAVFDFFDGFAARWLRAYSPIGKELDSLADLVSFGVAPASIMYTLLLPAVENYGLQVNAYSYGWWVAVLAFVIVVFSALRLAKFNIDTRQTDSFIGLPTPANASFICSLAFVSSVGNQQMMFSVKLSFLSTFADNMFFLLAITLIFSYLLVAEFPLFSLKFKSFDWKNNKIKYIFVLISALFLILFQWAGLALVILLYIFLSIFNCILHKDDVST